jgi:hypothetical protein
LFFLIALKSLDQKQQYVTKSSKLLNSGSLKGSSGFGGRYRGEVSIEGEKLGKVIICISYQFRRKNGSFLQNFTRLHLMIRTFSPTHVWVYNLDGVEIHLKIWQLQGSWN